MSRTWLTAGLLAAVGGWMAAGRSGAIGDEPPAAPPDPARAARFAAIRAEFDAQRAATLAAMDKAATEAEQGAIYGRMAPDDAAYSRRMVDLAREQPADPTARDACVWVISKYYRSDEGAYGDEFARAAALLVRHHGDDPLAVGVGLNLEHVLTARRDALLFGFLASARSRESKGLARMALGRYLKRRAEFIEAARKHPQRWQHTETAPGADGKPESRPVDESDDDHAYHLALALGDPAATRAEAERLFGEVVADYGDVLVGSKNRALAATLAQPTPTRDGRPLTPDEVARDRATLARALTLGKFAADSLDDMNNLTAGRPAPEIDGVTLDGRPLKLSDYRGKVVLLVFWASWCGPCVAAIPEERALAEKYKDRPFAVLGVDCKDKLDAARQVVAAERVTWPSWHDGDGTDGDGPIVDRYHIRGYPATFLIDDKGVIRHRDLSDEALDRAVAKLLDEMAGPAPP